MSLDSAYLELDPVPEREQLGARHRCIHWRLPKLGRLTGNLTADDGTVVDTASARDLLRQMVDAGLAVRRPGQTRIP